MLEAVVDDTYDWFVGLVAERRNLPPAEARRLADGSIYTGRQALRLKLIDAVGGDEEARAWLAAEKGISKDLAAPRMEEGRVVLPAPRQQRAWPGSRRLVGLEPGAAAFVAATACS